MTPAMNALIVEDDKSWQGILSEILSDHELVVDVVDNLQDATDQLRDKPYRLAVVDLSLVGSDHHNQDGLQVLNSIQRLAPNCVSILLSGYTSVELAVTAIQDYGAFTCLRKETFRRAEFRKAIQQALSSPGMSAESSSESIENRDEIIDTSSKMEHLGGKSVGRALVVEDDAGWSSLLSELLADSGYRVNTSTSYGEAIGLLNREHYQIAVIDISLANSLEPNQNQDGYRLLSSTRQAKIPTIVVSGMADPDLIDRAYAEHNIFACLEKQSFERNKFLEYVRRVAALTTLPQNLTERESEVLVLVTKGMGNKEIAAQLFISTNTVKRHLKSIFTKLDVNSRAAASAYAIRMGLELDNDDG